MRSPDEFTCHNSGLQWGSGGAFKQTPMSRLLGYKGPIRKFLVALATKCGFSSVIPSLCLPFIRILVWTERDQDSSACLSATAFQCGLKEIKTAVCVLVSATASQCGQEKSQCHSVSVWTEAI
eukprot:1141114-Pelagomonas_calceolata.AAC.3